MRWRGARRHAVSAGGRQSERSGRPPADKSTGSRDRGVIEACPVKQLKYGLRFVIITLAEGAVARERPDCV